MFTGERGEGKGYKGKLVHRGFVRGLREVLEITERVVLDSLLEA